MNDQNTNSNKPAQNPDPPRVSILIACYNGAPYLGEAITSCLEQSHPNIEVCLADDGSTDDSLNIMQKFAEKFQNIKVTSFPENRGKVAAFNAAFAMSSGAYVALLGADDVCYPNRIEISLNKLKSQFADMVWSINLFEVDQDLKPIPFPWRKLSDLPPISVDSAISGNFASGGTMLITRSMAEICFPIPEHLKFEDWWLTFHCVLHGVVKAFEEPVIKYRRHQSNEISALNSDMTRVKSKDYLRQIPYLEALKKSLVTNHESPKFHVSQLERIEEELHFRRIITESSLRSRIRQYLAKTHLSFMPTRRINLLASVFFGIQVFRIKSLLGRRP